jgi:hypothetical protein
VNQKEKEKEKEKEKKSRALTVAELVALGCSEESAADLLALRTKLKAPLTALAWKGLASEFGKAGYTVDEGIATMSLRGWRSFQSGWVPNRQPTGNSSSSPALC